MEVNRVDSEGPVKWILKGEMDDDSVLRMESLILNSQDRGAHVIIDLTGLTSLNTIGVATIDHISREMENTGGQVDLIGNERIIKNMTRSV